MKLCAFLDFKTGDSFIRLRQGDFPGTAFPGAAGALTFTSTFLVPPPPPKNWPPNMKSAAATMITKITNIATTAALLPPLHHYYQPYPSSFMHSLFASSRLCDRVRRLRRAQVNHRLLALNRKWARITQTGRKIFRRFRATALPIVMLNPLRKIDGSRTNDPHSLTKCEIQTHTAKLRQAVRQIASANDC